MEVLEFHSSHQLCYSLDQSRWEVCLTGRGGTAMKLVDDFARSLNQDGPGQLPNSRRDFIGGLGKSIAIVVGVLTGMGNASTSALSHCTGSTIHTRFESVIRASSLRCRNGTYTSCRHVFTFYCGRQITVLGYRSGETITNCCGHRDSRWYITPYAEGHYSCWLSRAYTSNFPCNCC